MEKLQRHFQDQLDILSEKVLVMGGLVVPLALLFWWLRFRVPKTDDSAAAGEAAG